MSLKISISDILILLFCFSSNITAQEILPLDSTLVAEDTVITKIAVADSVGNIDTISLANLEITPQKKRIITVIQGDLLNVTIQPVKEFVPIDSIPPTRILFCGGIDNNLPIGVSDKFILQSSSNYIYGYYSKGRPLESSSLIRQIYAFNENSPFLLQSDTLKIKPKWEYTFFKCNLEEVGEYDVKILDKEMNLLGIGRVAITD